MPITLIVNLDIVPDRFDEFLADARSHAARSVEVEEGCLAFDVLLPREHAHRVVLVERYRDDAALESHWSSPHMTAYLERTGPMIAARERVLCDG